MRYRKGFLHVLFQAPLALIALSVAAKQTIATSLGLLGVTAPEMM